LFVKKRSFVSYLILKCIILLLYFGPQICCVSQFAKKLLQFEDILVVFYNESFWSFNTILTTSHILKEQITVYSIHIYVLYFYVCIFIILIYVYIVKNWSGCMDNWELRHENTLYTYIFEGERGLGHCCHPIWIRPCPST
jgi:hypothetical protein